MKIKRVLSQQEVDATLRDNGVEPMPWDGGELILENLGLTNIEAVNKMKLGDPITYDESGNVIPLSQRFNPESANIGYSIAPASLAMAPPKGVTAKTTAALPVWVVPKAEDALPKN
ncbi:MAG: hypothetical protein JZU63_05245, partial [Rhodoferax sp.]|nr:hypothetical protein [Rhodoferax sp.]